MRPTKRSYIVYDERAEREGTRNAKILTVAGSLQAAKDCGEPGIIFSYFKKGNSLTDERCEGPTRELQLQVR